MANIELRVLDTRIAARFREPRPSDIIVGTATDLATIITRITSALGSNRLSRLSVACHGIAGGVADPRMAMSRIGGGFGLALGSSDLTFSTVGEFSALAGKFAPGGMMDIYACSAADDSSTGGFTGNGRLLMRELAGQINATVRASDATQLYTHGVTGYTLFGATLYSTYEGADFGEWEGNVWMFMPDGSRRQDSAPGAGVR